VSETPELGRDERSDEPGPTDQENTHVTAMLDRAR
jgi:hypothetical protein